MKFSRIILLVLTAVSFAAADCGAADDNARLVKAIMQKLMISCPKINPAQIQQVTKREAFWITTETKEINDRKALYDKLAAEFSANEVLKMDPNSFQAETAAWEITQAFFAESNSMESSDHDDQDSKRSNTSSTKTDATNTSTNMTDRIKNEPAPVQSKFFYLEAGTVILRPFSVDPVTGRLNPHSADVRGMIDGVFKSRYAWWKEAENGDFNSTNGIQNLVYGWDKPSFDFEIQLGYAFGDGSTQNSAAPGTGDAFGEASLGWNMFKIRQDANTSPNLYTVNLEAFGGFVTDKGDILIHPSFGAGVSFVAGIPWLFAESSPSRPKCEILTRLGFAYVDSITVNNGTVTTDINGNPIFTMKGAVQVKSELRIPVIPVGTHGEKGYGYLSFGGTFYKIYEAGPDNWSMYAAISFPVEGLLVLKGLFGN